MNKKSTKIKKENRLGIAISNEDKEQLERIALKKDISMSAISRIAIKEYIEREGI